MFCAHFGFHFKGSKKRFFAQIFFVIFSPLYLILCYKILFSAFGSCFPRIFSIFANMFHKSQRLAFIRSWAKKCFC